MIDQKPLFDLGPDEGSPSKVPKRRYMFFPTGDDHKMLQKLARRLPPRPEDATEKTKGTGYFKQLHRLEGALAIVRLFGGALHTTPDIAREGVVVLPSGETAWARVQRDRGRDFTLSDQSMESFRADLGILLWPPLKDFPIGSLEAVGWVTRDEFEERAIDSTTVASLRALPPCLVCWSGTMNSPQALVEHLGCQDRGIDHVTGTQYTPPGALNGLQREAQERLAEAQRERGVMAFQWTEQEYEEALRREWELYGTIHPAIPKYDRRKAYMQHLKDEERKRRKR